MKKIIAETILVCAIIATTGYGIAQSWRQTGGGGGNAVCMTASADGKIILVAGSAYSSLSTNSGMTWTTNYIGIYGGSMASSADGKRIIAGLEYNGTNAIFLSTNSGNAWNLTPLPNGFYHGSACTADGQWLACAESDGPIFTSTNSGETWQTNDVASGVAWKGMTASASGNLLAVAGYFSTNWGISWQPVASPGGNVATSADGTRLIAAGDSESSEVYISTNSGSSWMPEYISGTYVASSADGRVLLVANDDDSQINISTNYGENWSTTNITGSKATSVACSADGNELLVGEYGEYEGEYFVGAGIWTYQVTPTPTINIAMNANAATLSWLVPSTNFTIESSPDLANWSLVTNSPTLNLTNLNDEITLPLTNGAGFFRLNSG